ncbi:MAG: DUF4476 domain-containing protein [Crocinitomicaceae bacterium]|jgi:hypothetical protein|nr:DUF4476 domain-containing protein [Crocinitomicaceae bacterium]
MKKITTLLFLFVCLVSFGQSTLTIFNNGGQQFYVILNGIKQNSAPQTNVSVSGINNGSYSVKLIFADGKTRDIDKNFMLDEPSFVTTRVIFKKGKGKLQMIGMEPANGQNGTGTNIIYRPNNSAVYSDAVVTQTVTTNTQQTTIPANTQQNGTTTINTSGSGQNQSSGTTTINTQTTTSDPTMQNGNVGINMNVNGTTNQVPQSGSATINVQTTTSDPTLQNGNVGINMNVNGTTNQVPQSGSATINVQTTTSDPTLQNGNVGINMNVNGTTNQNSQSGTTTINTQTTTNDPTMQNGNMGINMNVNVTDPTMNNGQGGVNMSINMSGTGVGTNTTINETQTVNQTTTTTVTTNGTQTTTSGGTQTITTNTNMNGQSTNTNVNTNPNTNVNSSSNQVVSSATSQNFVSCQKIMGDVNVYLKDLEEFDFEDDKMDLTKKDFVGTCMTASQAYKLVEIYAFEENRLEIAKYLYPRIIDKDNAKTIIPLFTFDSTKLEFREFIRN